MNQNLKKSIVLVLTAAILAAGNLTTAFASESADVVVFPSSQSGTATSTSTTATTTAEQSVINETAKKTLELINAERAKYGLTALKNDETMFAFAQKRADELVISYSHTRPSGEKWSTVYGDSLKNLYYWAENIAEGQKTPEEVVKDWMNSESHRKTIVDDKYTHGTIAYAVDSQGQIHWVNHFWVYSPSYTAK